MTSDPQHCPLCGQANQCGASQAVGTGQPCWCFSAPIEPSLLQRIPAEQRNQACVCRTCAEQNGALAAED